MVELMMQDLSWYDRKPISILQGSTTSASVHYSRQFVSQIVEWMIRDVCGVLPQAKKLLVKLKQNRIPRFTLVPALFANGRVDDVGLLRGTTASQ